MVVSHGRVALGRAAFEGVLVMCATQLCSVVQAIFGPKGRGSPSPGQRPGETDQTVLG